MAGYDVAMRVVSPAMSALLVRLWPFFKTRAQIAADPHATSGRMELIGIFAISILRTWQVRPGPNRVSAKGARSRYAVYTHSLLAPRSLAHAPV